MYFYCHQVPGEGEHPLQYNYAIWYSRRSQSNKSVRYDQNLKFIASFASVCTFSFDITVFLCTVNTTFSCPTPHQKFLTGHLKKLWSRNNFLAVGTLGHENNNYQNCSELQNLFWMCNVDIVFFWLFAFWFQWYASSLCTLNILDVGDQFVA